MNNVYKSQLDSMLILLFFFLYILLSHVKVVLQSFIPNISKIRTVLHKIIIPKKIIPPSPNLFQNFQLSQEQLQPFILHLNSTMIHIVYWSDRLLMLMGFSNPSISSQLETTSRYWVRFGLLFFCLGAIVFLQEVMYQVVPFVMPGLTT